MKLINWLSDIDDKQENKTVAETVRIMMFFWMMINETKKCWKFELDIMNSSGVIATQIYIPLWS